MTDALVRSLLGTAAAPEMRMSKRYRADRAQLWDALTSPERLGRWLGDIGGAPRAVGDRFTVTFPDAPESPARGTVIDCSHAERLVVRWEWEGEQASVVAVDLVESAWGTVLSLAHRLAEPDHVAAYGGGWERSLADLAAQFGEVAASGTVTSGAATSEAEAASRWQSLRDRALELAIDLPVPREVAWEAFTTEDGLRAWWWRHWDDVDVRVDARVGGDYRIDAPGAGIGVHGNYLVLDAPHRLAFTWRWVDDDGESVDETCELRFDATDEGCRLTLRHTGPWADATAAEDYRVGWEQTLSSLVRHLVR